MRADGTKDREEAKFRESESGVEEKSPGYKTCSWHRGVMRGEAASTRRDKKAAGREREKERGRRRRGDGGGGGGGEGGERTREASIRA